MHAKYLVALVLLLVPTNAQHLAAFGQGTAPAEDEQPVAVLAVTNLGQLLGQARYLANQVTGGQATGPLALASAWLQGIDMQRPLGVLFYLEDTGPRGIGFVPVTDFDRFRKRIEERLGKAKDTGRGIFRMSVGGQAEVYFRPTPQWVFVADSRRHLLKIPREPLQYVAPLIKDDTVAFRFSFSALPTSARDTIRQELDGLVDYANELVRQRQDSAASIGQVQVELQQQQLRAIRQFLDDAESVTIAARVTPEAHRMSVNLTLKFASDSSWVRQWKDANANDEGGDVLALRQPDAALTFFARHQLTKLDQETWKSMLTLMQQQVLTGLKQDDQRDLAKLKPLVEEFFQQIQATVKGRTMAMSGTLWLQDQVTRFGVAFRVDDGRAIESIFRKFVTVESDSPGFPAVKLDVAKSHDVTMHELSIALPESEQEARLVFGPQLAATFGFGPKAVYLVLGEGGTQWLTQQLESPQPSKLDPGCVMETVVALGPLLKNLPEADEEKRNQIRQMARLLESTNGRDRIHFTASQDARTLQYRLDVGDGVLKLLGGLRRAANDNSD